MSVWWLYEGKEKVTRRRCFWKILIISVGSVSCFCCWNWSSQEPKSVRKLLTKCKDRCSGKHFSEVNLKCQILTIGLQNKERLFWVFFSSESWYFAPAFKNPPNDNRSERQYLRAHKGGLMRTKRLLWSQNCDPWLSEISRCGAQKAKECSHRL